MSDVEAAVRNTGVHKTTTVGAKFAVSVFIRGFIGDIMAVWVFVATTSEVSDATKFERQRSMKGRSA